MSKSNSWGALDVAKFLCVLMMVFIHSIFALLTDADEAVDVGNRVFPLLAQLTVLGLLPLSIPATAGASLRLHLETYWEKGRVRNYSMKTVLRASLAIALLGFLMNYLAWGIGEIFQWDALQFIGLCFLLLTLVLRWIPAWAVYAFAVAVLAVTPWLRDWLASRENLLTVLLVGSRRVDGYWPFFPWFFTVAFGFALADLHHRLRNAEVFQAVAGLAGIGLVAASLALGQFWFHLDADHLWGPTIFQPSRGFILGLCGFFALLLTASGWFASRMEFTRYGLVNSFSKGVLWIYLFHVSLADHLGPWIRRHMSLEVASFVFPGVMGLMCWGVGALSLYLAGKRIRVVLARTA